MKIMASSSIKRVNKYNVIYQPKIIKATSNGIDSFLLEEEFTNPYDAKNYASKFIKENLK